MRQIFPRLFSIAVFSSALLFADDSDLLQKTGLRPPTPAEVEWANGRMIRAELVRPNKQALKRHNEMLKRRHMKQLREDEVQLAPDGEEMVGVAGKKSSPKGSAGLQAEASGPVLLSDAVDNSAAPFFPVILNQQRNSCAAYATAYYTMTYMFGRARGWDSPERTFSPKWSYNLANNGEDNGSSIEGNARVLMEHGCVSYSEWPENENYREWPRTAALWRSALDYRIENFGVLPFRPSADIRTMANLKQMLANGYVGVIWLGSMNFAYATISDDPATTSDDAAAGQLIIEAEISGGEVHAMTVVGYDDNVWLDINGNGIVDMGEKGAFKLANSWGPSYGNSGFIWVAYDAFFPKSRVEGAPFFSDRVMGWGGEIYWLTARQQYRPKAYAEFRLNHPMRNEQKVWVGIGPTNSSVPQYAWFPGVFQYTGGPYAFNGTNTACDGDFVIDYTDIMNEHGIDNTRKWRWFLGYGDTIADPYTGKMKSFSLIDEQAGAKRCDADETFSNVNNNSGYGLLDYRLGKTKYNYPPLVMIPQDTIFLRGIMSTTLSATVRDEGLPVGSNLTVRWRKMSGPGTVTFENRSAATTTAQFSAPGSYVLRLSAYDSQLSGYDEVKVSVFNTLGYAQLGDPTAAIAIDGNYAYLSSFHWQIVDCTDKTNPVIVWTSPALGNNQGGIAARGNYVYLLSSDPYGVDLLRVYDVSDKANPSEVRVISVQFDGAYNDICLDGQYLYVAGYNLLHIFDLTDPSNPVEISTFAAENPSGAPDDVYDQEPNIWGMSVQGNLVGIASYGHWSLVDISDRWAPTLLAQVPMGPQVLVSDIAICGSRAYLATMAGMEIWDIANPRAPARLSGSAMDYATESGWEIEVSGERAYLTGPDFAIVDISDPANPVTLAQNWLPYRYSSTPFAAADSANIYIAHEGLYILQNMSVVRKATVDPAWLDFGAVAVENRRTQLITMSNWGNATTTVSAIAMDNSAFVYVRPTVPFTIPPKSSVTLTLRFYPNEENSFVGTMQISSDAADNPLLVVSLQGVGYVNTPPTVVSAASVDANPVIGNSANLSVLGDDDLGEGNLTYSWALIGMPPAPVSFSSNWGNDSKNTWVSFTEPGSYNFEVTITDGQGLGTTSQVEVTVVRSAATVMISPMENEIALGQSSQYAFTVVDQFGVEMHGLQATWQVVTDYMIYKAEVSIDQTGLVTAGSVPGGYIVRVTVQDHNGNDVSGDAPGRVFIPNDQPPRIITPASATPNPVNGNEAVLSVGADDDGTEANLSYEWTITSGSSRYVYFLPSYNRNNTTIVFRRAGVYDLRVAITDAAGLACTSSVTITVNSIFSSISIYPTYQTVESGSTVQFAASAYDQFNRFLISQPVFAWLISGGGGTISSEGLFTAGDVPGDYEVTASAGGITGTAWVTIPQENLPPTIAVPVSITIDPDNSRRVHLSILGQDDGGEGNLTYSWYLNSEGQWAYNDNYSNEAKNITVDIQDAGTYDFCVFIFDAQGLWVRSDFTVTVE